MVSLVGKNKFDTFQEKRDLDFSATIDGGYRFRVNSHYQQETIALSFRVISNNIPLIDELHRADDMELITTRHEHNASYAAYGYAAAKGGPAACISTLGPGSTNLIAGVAAAYKAAPSAAHTTEPGDRSHLSVRLLVVPSGQLIAITR